MAKTGGTTVETPKASNSTSFKAGDTVVCIKSESVAYTEGKTYEVYINEQGWKCIRGEDGLEDIVSMMVSSFKKIN